MDYQKIQMTGTLTADPKITEHNGTKIANCRTACNVSKKVKDEYVTVPQWFSFSLFGKRAEFAEANASKGKKIFVAGELMADETGNPPSWSDDSGGSHSRFEIRVTDFILLGDKRKPDEEEEFEFI